MGSRLNNDRENFTGTLSFHTICSLMLIHTFSLKLLSRSPPSNSIDVFANGVGFIAIVDQENSPDSMSPLGVGWV